MFEDIERLKYKYNVNQCRFNDMTNIDNLIGTCCIVEGLFGFRLSTRCPVLCTTTGILHVLFLEHYNLLILL